MRYTVAIEYGITAILYIGLESSESRVGKSKYITIEEISQNCDLSRNHLIKVIHLLGQTDILITIRGRSGGMILGKQLTEISLGEVVYALRSTPQVRKVDSFQQDVRQLLAVPLQDAEQRYQESLNQVTFAALVAQYKTTHQRDLGKKFQSID